MVGMAASRKARTFTVSAVEARHRQPGMLEGLSRFLVQHERCGAGFDVAHPAGLGSGRVSITCRGCGARHEYATATIEVERELRIEGAPLREGTSRPSQSEPASPPQRIPPRPAPYPESAPETEEPPAATGSPSEAQPGTKTAEEILRAHAAKAEGTGQRRRGGRPAIATPSRSREAEAAGGRLLRSPAAILALVAVSAVALGLGVVWLVNEAGNGEDPTTQPFAAPPPTPPTQIDPAAPVGTPPSPVPGAPQPRVATVQTERFSVEVPRGWSRRAVDGGLLLEPHGGARASVRIFYELSPELTAARMARQTEGFMTRLVPGAKLLPNQARIAGGSAFELTARGPGETAIAVNVLRGPYRYLLLRRIFAGAKPQTNQAASQIVRSFRPS